MAGLGTLVATRFPPPDRVGTSEELGLPNGFELLSAYSGPPAPLLVALDPDGRSTWVSGDVGHVLLPWGPVDNIDSPGAYARLSSGIRSDPGGLDVHVRLVGTSLRATKRWLEIEADGSRYVLGRNRWQRTRLQRDGQVVADRFGGATARLAIGVTDLDSVVAALVWASLGQTLHLPKALDGLVIPGP